MSNLKVLHRLLQIFSPLKYWIIIAIFTGVLGFLVSIFIPFFTILAINNSNFILMIIIFGITRGIFRYIEQWTNHFVAFKLLAIIRSKCFIKFIKLTPSWLEKYNHGDLIQMISHDVEALEVLYAHTISPIFIAIFTEIIILFILFYNNIVIGFIGLISMFIIGVILPQWGIKKTSDYSDKRKMLLGELSSKAYEYLFNMPVIRNFNQVLLFKKKLLHQVDKTAQMQNQVTIYENIITSFYSSIISISVLLSILLIDFHNINDIALVVLLASSYGPLIALANLGSQLSSTLASAKRIINFLDTEILVDENQGSLFVDSLDINFDNVSFKYPETTHTVLNKFNKNFKYGKIYGIKGVSGIGKSTVIKLIMRYYYTDMGEIYLGNKNIKNINIDEWRNNIVLMDSCEHYFDSLTLRQNLLIGNLNATDNILIEALKKVNLNSFIDKLDENIKTFSQGEKQRIALARLLISEAKLLLLDEATSNLDILNEGLILKILSEDKRGKIIVSHQDSTLSICDEIIEIKR